MDSSKNALQRIANDRKQNVDAKKPKKRSKLRLHRRQQTNVNLLAAVVGLSEKRK